MVMCILILPSKLAPCILIFFIVNVCSVYTVVYVYLEYDNLITPGSQLGSSELDILKLQKQDEDSTMVEFPLASCVVVWQLLDNCWRADL